MNIQELAHKTKQASIHLSAKSAVDKNAALKAIASSLNINKGKIVEANKKDIEEATKNNLEAPLLKRLKFDESKIDGVIDGINSLIALKDPVGETQMHTELDTGLDLYKVSCPIGVIGVIFESRPDALVQISTLCLKSGNGVLLKGGSEAFHTNRALAEIISEASVEVGMPQGWIQLLETRSDVSEMLKCDEDIDLIIPRGSNEFVKYIMDNSNIPVLGHADGICHVYVDSEANIDMAVSLAVDSKCQYVAVCNAAETILVNAEIAKEFLPKLKAGLDKFNVEIYGDEATQSIIKCEKAAPNQWKTEYLDFKVSIRIVEGINEAIDHINTYGSGHTETIITENKSKVQEFMSLADSGNVFWNCSTRFSDGFRYGFGAEVGISTNKIHARGPVGLDGLLIYKFLMKGKGQTVAPYAEGEKQFTHKQSDETFSI
jgi:glutamate-5-semialdehyde dehydrogenase